MTPNELLMTSKRIVAMFLRAFNGVKSSLMTSNKVLMTSNELLMTSIELLMNSHEVLMKYW